MSRRYSRSGLVIPDHWLTETLGIRTFSFRGGSDIDEPLLISALARCASTGKAFFFAKVPVGSSAQVNKLQKLGFRLVETQVTFEYGGGKEAATDLTHVREAVRADKKRVIDIAGSCFEFSRFHQDPIIGRKNADKVKRNWARNCLEGGRGDGVLVAGNGRSVSGFLAVKLSKEAGTVSAAIDLIGVDISSQRCGTGTSLVEAFVERWHGNASRLLVGTQISNARSIRLYERCGFRFRDAVHVMHAHWQRGRPAWLHNSKTRS